MNAVLRLSLKLYRGLVRLYPDDLQNRFGPEMVDVFEQQLVGAWAERRAAGIARIWCCVVAEAATGAAVPAMVQAAILPVASVLASFALFLAFIWAAGFAKPCG
jgi:hypothetical protein